MTRVLHIIAPVSFGGGESLLATLTKEKKESLNEQVFTVFASPRFERALESHGIKHHRLSNIEISHGIGKWKNAIQFLKAILSIHRLFLLLYNYRPQVIHAHGFPSNIVAILSKLTTATSSLYTHHSYKPRLNHAEANIMGAVYRSFNRCTSVSKAACKAANRSINEKQRFIVVHNCIDWKFYKKSEQTSHNRTTPAHFIYIARFIPCKNHLILPQAVKKLNDTYGQRVVIHLVGDGELKQKFEHEISRLNIQDQFILHGSIAHEELPKLIASCHYGLFPAQIEGFGIAAVECMAKGLPVLAFDNELMREVIAEAGVLAIEGEFHKGFHEIIESGNLKRSTAIEQGLRFTPKAIKKHYFTIYEGLTSTPVH